MAARDVNFYKFLIESFRHKLTPRGAVDSYYSNGLYSLPYNGPQGIFYFARKYLPARFKQGLTLTETDLEKNFQANLEYARRVINALDTNKAPDLKEYENTASINELDTFHQQVQDAVTKHVQDIEEYPKQHKFSGVEHPSAGQKTVKQPPAAIQPLKPAESTEPVEPAKPAIPQKPPSKAFSFLKKPLPRFNKPKLEIPSLAKDAGVTGEIGLNKVLTRAPGFVANFFKGTPEEQQVVVVGEPTAATGVVNQPESSGINIPGNRGSSKAAPGSGFQKLAKPGKNKLVFIIVGIILFIVLLSFFYGNNLLTPPTSTAGQLVINKSGPAAVANGETIEYLLSVSFNGSGGAKDIVLTDTVPEGTEFQSASDGSTPNSKNTLTWNIPQLGSNQSWSVKLTVKATKDDFWAQNQASAEADIENTNRGSGSQVTGDSIKDIADFNVLMRGQGRNTNALGNSEDEFINNLRTNLAGTARASLLNEEARLKQIYNSALSKQVNPLVILTTWGTEAAFDRSYDNIAFGCDPHGMLNPSPRGFTDQLSCSVNTWNNLMKEFEAQGGGPVTLPSALGKNCVYTDPFIYATERYGPICTVNDANDNHRKSFVAIYKMLLGVK